MKCLRVRLLTALMIEQREKYVIENRRSRLRTPIWSAVSVIVNISKGPILGGNDPRKTE